MGMGQEVLMLVLREMKTARELGLTHAMYDGLCEVLRRLQCGELRYGTLRRGRGDKINMGQHPLRRLEDGAIGCIAAWSRAYFPSGDGALRVRRTRAQWDAYLRLVTPPLWRRRASRYREGRMIRALESYLMTGEADWT